MANKIKIKRPGAGQPRKEPTKTVTYRIPADLKEKLRQGDNYRAEFIKWAESVTKQP